MNKTNTEDEVGIVLRATHFARWKHAGQVRRYTGEPYADHVVAVAEAVANTGASPEVVAAALLHDTLEDTETTAAELVEAFGYRIADLVVELTDQFTDLRYGNRAARKGKERDRLAKVSAEAQTIKVADLIDNTGTIAAHDPRFAKVYLEEKRALLEVLTRADVGLLDQARRML